MAGEAAVLTPFGVEVRYRGDSPELPSGIERELLGIVERVRASVSEIARR